MEEIVIWNQANVSKKLRCPICQDEQEKNYLLKTLNPLKNPEYLDLYRCLYCDSCFFYPINLPGYHAEQGDWGGTLFLKFYLDVGMGTDFMASILAALRSHKRIKQVLEIGCGVGFAMDFAQRELGWQATGVEPSSFAEIGTKLFKLKIYNDYLENIKELKQQKFDLIYAVEVIEHVKDPTDFLQLLKTYLKPEGVLLFTTPNAKGILSSQHTPWLLMPMLFPGFHINLFSPKGIQILLNQQGLTYVEIIETSHQLVVYASTKKFNIKNFNRSQYCNYLKSLLKNINEDSILYEGIFYRLFKDKINQGKYAEAEKIFENFASSLRIKYSQDIFYPEKITPIILQSTLQNLADSAPYYIANLYYYYGILQLNYHKNYPLSTVYFKYAFIMAQHLQKLAATGETSELFWFMKFSEGLSLLLNENREQAIAVFNFITDNKNQENFAIAPRDNLVHDALYHEGLAELQQSNYNRAIELFNQVLRMQKNAKSPLIDKVAMQLGTALALQIHAIINETHTTLKAKKIILKTLRHNMVITPLYKVRGKMRLVWLIHFVLRSERLRTFLKKSKLARYLYTTFLT